MCPASTASAGERRGEARILQEANASGSQRLRPVPAETPATSLLLPKRPRCRTRACAPPGVRVQGRMAPAGTWRVVRLVWAHGPERPAVSAGRHSCTSF